MPILIFILLICFHAVFAIEVELTGVITDRQGRPLPSIVVTLASQNLSDTTDIEGKYALVSPSSSSEGLYSSSSSTISSSSQAFSSSSQAPSSSGIASLSSSSEEISYSSSADLSSSSFEPPLRLLNAQRQSSTGNTAYFSANGKKWQSPRLWNLSKQPYYQKNQKSPLALQNRQALAFATASDELTVTQNGTPLAKIPVVSYKAALGATAVIPYSTFTDDRDGRIYRYVEIGGQYWMAQNLNYGDMVAPTSAQDEDDIAEKYCLGNDTLNCTQWGGLYTWSEAMGLPSWCNTLSCATKINAAGHRGICPDGWTLPTSADWASLVANTTGDASTAGLELKSDTGWVMNYDGTNSYGFSALPIGNRNAKKNFVNYGTHAYWWTADEYGAETASNRFLYGGLDGLNSATSDKSDFGFGVRCVFGTPTPDGLVSWEKWNGKFKIASIPISTTPDDTGTWTLFESPQNVGDQFGQRARAYLYPPQDGYYTFWISSDNESVLYISNNSNPFNKDSIASVLSYTAFHDWTKYPSQKSKPIYLQSIRRYYIEVLMVEGTSNDNLTVGWSKPGEPTTTPSEIIPGKYLNHFN